MYISVELKCARVIHSCVRVRHCRCCSATRVSGARTVTVLYVYVTAGVAALRVSVEHAQANREATAADRRQPHVDAQRRPRLAQDQWYHILNSIIHS